MHPRRISGADGSDEPPRWSLPGFDLQRLLGFGATGEVWQAVELATGTRVALKRLRPDAQGRGRDRLRQEAAMLAAVDSPYLVRLRTALPTTEGLVLVLELAEGGSLAWLLAGRGRLDPGEVVTLATPVAEALAAAHDAGVVHGDVTPSNILFAADGRPMLADLGVAALAGAPQGPVDGTCEYLDPMVALGGRPGTASDVHGLAACCHHALTGRAPYRADVPGAPDLAAGAPDCPPDLIAAVRAGMDPDPSRRPSAVAFAASLRAATPSAPVRLNAGPVAPVQAPQTREVHPGPKAAPAPGAGRSRQALLLVVPVVVVLLIAGVAALVGVRALGGQGPAPASSSSTSSSPPATSAVDALSVEGPLAEDSARALVTALQAARDQALVTADREALGEVYVPGVRAGEADLATLDALAAQGATAQGLAHQVSAVELVDQSAEQARLTVTDRLAAYQVLGPDGAVLADRPARAAQTFTWRLQIVEGGWRIAAIDAT